MEAAWCPHTAVEIRELVGIRVFDRIADAAVVCDPGVPVHPRIRQERGFGDFRHNFLLRQQLGAGRFASAPGAMDTAGGILHRNGLRSQAKGWARAWQIGVFCLDQAPPAVEGWVVKLIFKVAELQPPICVLRGDC